MSAHNRVLWVLQWLLGLYFIAFGIMHFVLPDGLPEVLTWLYELDQNRHRIAGTAEILGGLGLILPAITRIAPQLVSWAALGLIAVMVGAIIFHAPREEYLQIGINVVDILLLGYVGYGRWKLAPLEQIALEHSVRVSRHM